MTEPPGHKPQIVNGVVLGPFEEEEEGICVTSAVVEGQGENLTTPKNQRTTYKKNRQKNPKNLRERDQRGQGPKFLHRKPCTTLDL